MIAIVVDNFVCFFHAYLVEYISVHHKTCCETKGATDGQSFQDPLEASSVRAIMCQKFLVPATTAFNQILHYHI